MSGWPTLADVKSLLRMRTADELEDPLIEAALRASIEYVDGRTGHRFTDPQTGDVDVSAQAFEAVCLMAARLYRRRDSLDGTIGWGDQGVVRVGRVDPDVEALIGGDMWTVIG
jgi:hypothetical protein